MEFAATLPVKERVSGLTTKAFLKRYASHYLPGFIVNRKKRGLSVPFASWLRGPLYEYALTRLRSPLFAEAGINPNTVVDLLDEHRKRKADYSRSLWTLIVLSEWMDWLMEHPKKIAERIGVEPAVVETKGRSAYPDSAVDMPLFSNSHLLEESN